MESIFAGALIAISSTTIIAKAFDEQGIGGRLRELVVSILIVEDMIAVLLLAVLTGVASGSELSATELAATLARLLGFLVAFVAFGLLVIPPLMRAIVKIGRTETTIVASIGVCFGSALLAHALGYSVALGAFVGGMLVAASGEVRQIEPLVHPVRDIFAALFFVSVGMLIDPGAIAQHWLAVLLFTIVVIAGKVFGVTIGAFLTGNGTRTSIAAGFSLAQIGEFSFIIAGLGVTLGAIDTHVYSVAVAVSAITTLTTPWLIRASDRVAHAVDRKLPKPMQTFVALYESWLERVRAPRATRSQIRRLTRILLLDLVAAAAAIIAVSLAFDWLMAMLVEELGLAPRIARIVVVAAGGTLVLPFCVGILLITRRLANVIAEAAVPPRDEGALDLGMAPRKVLVATLQLAGVLIAGLPLIALTQPFLRGYTAAIVLVSALGILAIAFWRSTRALHGHVRSAAHVILEALAARSGPLEPRAVAADPLADVHALLPGLGEPEPVEIPPGSIAAGRTLAELELRATTGATVLAIIRGKTGIATPDAHDPLCVGDVLAIAGTHEAIVAARALLQQTSTRPTAGEAGPSAVSTRRDLP
jgi:CPA2 family monovalent cation:H+ antiporter-2